jgi:hypothetical protein
VGGAFLIVDKTGKKEEENGEKRGHYKSFQKSKKLSKFSYLFIS